jgi:hypothetical protein
VPWSCPTCGAPFGNSRASHSCVRVPLDDRFTGSGAGVRAAFDRLVELASVDGPIAVVAQKTRIVLAAPMRFLAIAVHRDRLTGHVFLERPVPHAVVTEILPNAYGSGLFLHRLAIRDASELDDDFAVLVRDAAARVGRRERLATPPSP